jgi:hypothetical protein
MGTGYLFIYNSADYSYENLVKSMMPDDWTPPEIPKTTPLEPAETDANEVTPSIIASQELLEDEEAEPKTPMTPLASKAFEFSVSPSPRLPPRAVQKPVVSTSSKQPISPDSKRPSLPTLQVNFNQLNVSTSPVTAAIVENTPEQQKESTWNWFSSSKKPKDKGK